VCALLDHLEVHSSLDHAPTKLRGALLGVHAYIRDHRANGDAGASITTCYKLAEQTVADCALTTLVGHPLNERRDGA
jgi:hypothetical protein